VLGDDALADGGLQQLHVDVALDSIRQIEPFRIAWAEEPRRPSSGYAELRRARRSRSRRARRTSGVCIDARAIDIVATALTGGGGFGEKRWRSWRK
jgi:L-alanine-DL-glutamate epimerase-like enolase superfamily enzyme